MPPSSSTVGITTSPESLCGRNVGIASPFRRAEGCLRVTSQVRARKSSSSEPRRRGRSRPGPVSPQGLALSALALPHDTGHGGLSTVVPVQRPLGSFPSLACGSQVQVVSLPHSTFCSLHPFPWHLPVLFVVSSCGDPVVGQLSLSLMFFQWNALLFLATGSQRHVNVRVQSPPQFLSVPAHAPLAVVSMITPWFSFLLHRSVGCFGGAAVLHRHDGQGVFGSFGLGAWQSHGTGGDELASTGDAMTRDSGASSAPPSSAALVTMKRRRLCSCGPPASALGRNVPALQWRVART